MSDIKAGTKYFLTNTLIGSSNVLTSTSFNDSVLVGPVKADGSGSWYLVETNTSGYFQLHTEQKGDFAALDVSNYNGKNSIDLHMYSVQQNTGQFWRFNKQDDGSFRINNQYTGSDIYLDVVKDTLQPTLAAKDGPGQRWKLNTAGSIPSPTSSASNSRATTSSVFLTGASVTGASIPTNSAVSDITSKNITGGAIGGIVAGAVVGAIVVLALIICLMRKRCGSRPLVEQPPAMRSRPVLHV